MSDFERLPQRVKRVIERCRSGATLHKFFRNKEGGNAEVLYAYEPGGKPAPPKSSEAAIASGFLRPNRDGLFDDGNSQTWRAA